MDPQEEAELCFPQLINTSCKKPMQHRSETTFIYILFSCISLVTVSLNLMVIISISHFRQLHTPTNHLLLSLAVSDFLVGFLLMPVRIRLMGNCWLWGSFMCALFRYTSFIITSSSVGNVILISIDRYVAINDPLSYPTKVTQKRVQFCVCLCWACCVIYNGAILSDFLKRPQTFYSCYGECGNVLTYVSGVVDVIITFIFPITLIIVLYMRVFVVAVTQARAMRSQIAAVSVQGSVGLAAMKSERKAAKTLGVVVVVFLMCFCPYFYPSLVTQETSTTFSAFGLWLLYCNSCFNPLIYAYFYPWFRKSIKLIVTLQILHRDSCDANVLQ
ncbi:trace amine-associated receptor 13c-like [Anabas testudineus]|uniref:trace amine-associated receptor 13c-like n=1 Tax=Anabas testudineus TaxID=64144 RepID=UPI000E4616EF|nr:trace amine-associated receptor 13c-like [Anabas testudineus]